MAFHPNHNETSSGPRAGVVTARATRASAPGRVQAARLRTLVLAAVAFGAVLLLGGCADNDRAAVAGARVQTVPLGQALDTMLRAPHAGAAESFLASLPRPLEATERSVRNAYDPRVEDTVRTLVYDDLNITVYEVTTTASRFPIAVTLTAPGQVSPRGLSVGLDRSSVRAVLGGPGAVDPASGAWHYDVMEQGSAPYAIDIDFEGDAVSSVTWTAYLD